MRAHRLAAMMYRDFLLLFRVHWKVAEHLYFPLTTVIIWGFFAHYSKTFSPQTGLAVLVVTIIWNFAGAAQSFANFQMMEDSWSSEFKPLIFTGISAVEYMASRLLASVVVSLLVLVALLTAAFFFGWSITYAPKAFALITLLTLLSALGVAVLVAAVLVFFGKDYGFLSWSAMQAFILFSAPFYPLTVLPSVLQYVASAMPFTFIFELTREMVFTGTLSSVLVYKATIVSVIYFFVGWPLYLLAFSRGKKNGHLLRFGR